MIINAHTRIGQILKMNPDALEAIVSISPVFEKLRNPFLRKIMAARTTLHMASKAGGCAISDFYSKLEPLGFKIDAAAEKREEQQPGSFILSIPKDKLKELDVRHQLESGADPLPEIMRAVNELPQGSTLKIINTFEPTPLILLLGKRGFESHVMHIRHDLVETYFHKAITTEDTVVDQHANDFDFQLAALKGSLHSIDVRHLTMPQPMITILDTLSKMKNEEALFVQHKRIPVFLLPELKERGFQYRIKKGIDEVQMLIFR